ncbi:hypothetical protein [Actinoallomurus sp. CA-150999]|uniref:hypothetical protein n=1 Tax=Actinoallomurus sp. CA-150999 TaxID=3239887 RepID=UPI003D8B94B8
MAVTLLLAGWSDTIDRGPVTMMPAGGPQQITGPDWAEAPTRVPPTLFGVTVASSTGDMPGFPVGAVRLWDSRTRWADLEPGRGRFAWPTLDRLVAGAGRARLPVLLTLGGTPAWASPSGPLGPYDDGSRAAPPDHLTDWDGFVRALVDRYRGRVAAYELWVMGNDPHYYNGRVETLVEMTRRASRIIKGADARATVVCPSMGRLWTAEGAAVLRRFAELGGYRYCDAAGVKLHQRRASDPPETMLTLTGEIDRILHEAGVRPPLWNTGTAYDFPLQTPLPQGTAAAYAARFYLVGLYARFARMYFYSWGNAHLPITLQADGGAPTAAANAVARLQVWLRDARITSCGHGAAIGVPANVWRCRFTAPGETRTVYWTDTGSARVAVGPGARGLDRIEGGGTTVHAGDALPVTQSPVLVRSS